MSKLEDTLSAQIKWVRLPQPRREYKFCSKRKWRADFAWPEYKVIVEVEGGAETYDPKKIGRHNRPKGFRDDCEKYNEATILGWRVLRVTAKQVKSGEALQWIEKLIV